MRIYGLLLLGLLLPACAWFNPNEVENEQKQEDGSFVRQLPNRFLWQACLDKLKFMDGLNADQESGVVSSEWTSLGEAEYKVEILIEGNELRSDNLDVKVFERLRGRQKTNDCINEKLTAKTETAIFNKARELYRESLNLQ